MFSMNLYHRFSASLIIHKLEGCATYNDRNHWLLQLIGSNALKKCVIRTSFNEKQVTRTLDIWTDDPEVITKLALAVPYDGWIEKINYDGSLNFYHDREIKSI